MRSAQGSSSQKHHINLPILHILPGSKEAIIWKDSNMGNRSQGRREGSEKAYCDSSGSHAW